jgi:hypothetical protein
MLAWLLLYSIYLECIQQILVDSAGQSGLTVREKKRGDIAHALEIWPKKQQC